MHAEVPHPINVLLNLFSIIKALLEYSFLFDLFEDAKLRDNFLVHSIKVCRLSHLRWSLALLTSRLIGHGSDRSLCRHLLLEVV